MQLEVTNFLTVYIFDHFDRLQMYLHGDLLEREVGHRVGEGEHPEAMPLTT